MKLGNLTTLEMKQGYLAMQSKTLMTLDWRNIGWLALPFRCMLQELGFKKLGNPDSFQVKPGSPNSFQVKLGNPAS